MNLNTSKSVTFQGIPLVLYPGLMERLILTCPDISFVASLGIPASELEDNLISHKTDLCISSKTIKNVNIAQKPIIKEPLLLIVSKNHPLSKKESVRIEDLLDENFLISIQYSSINRYYDMLFSNAKMKPPTYTISNLNECLEFVSINRCVTILTHSMYNDLLRRQTPATTSVLILDDNSTPFYFEQFLYYRKKNNTQKTNEARKILLDYFSKDYERKELSAK